MKEIKNRLQFLQSVGLDYLTLARSAGTLSGGESQRIRLTTQIGSALSGVLYVLDEPSIGLHQRDNDKLIATLKNLRDLGNTVIVVEHDEDTMRSAGLYRGRRPRRGRPRRRDRGRRLRQGHLQGQAQHHRRLSVGPQAHRGAADPPHWQRQFPHGEGCARKTTCAISM